MARGAFGVMFQATETLVTAQTSTEMAHTRFSWDDSPRKHVFQKMFRAKCRKKIVFVVVSMLIYMYVSSEKGDGRRTCSKADSVYIIQLFDLILMPGQKMFTRRARGSADSENL